MLMSVTWALWRTYSAGLEDGRLALAEAFKDICDSLHSRPSKEFYEAPSEFRQNTKMGNRLHELKLKLCTLETLALKVISTSMCYLGKLSDFKTMMEELVDNILVEMYPDQKDSLKTNFMNIVAITSHTKEIMEAMKSNDVVKPIPENQLEGLRQKLMSTSTVVCQDMMAVVEQVSFLNFQEPESILNQVLHMVDAFLNALRQTTELKKDGRVVPLVRQAEQTCEYVAEGAKSLLQHFEMLHSTYLTESLLHIKSSIDNEKKEATMYILNCELAKPILKSRESLPQTLKQLMQLSGAHAQVIERFQVIVQIVAFVWESGLSIPRVLTTPPSIHSAFAMDLLKLEVAYCTWKVKDNLGVLVGDLKKLCSSKAVKNLLSRNRDLSGCGFVTGDSDCGGSSSVHMGQLKFPGGKSISDRTFWDHKNSAVKLKEELRKCLQSNVAELVLNCDVIAAVQCHENVLREAHKSWKNTNSFDALSWDARLLGQMGEHLRSMDPAVFRSKLAMLWTGLYFVECFQFDRPPCTLLSTMRHAGGLALAREHKQEVLFLASNTQYNNHPLSLVLVTRCRENIRDEDLMLITHFCCKNSHKQRAWVSKWIEELEKAKIKTEFIEDVLLNSESLEKPVEDIGQAALSCLSTLFYKLCGKPMEIDSVLTNIQALHKDHEESYEKERSNKSVGNYACADALAELHYLSKQDLENPEKAANGAAIIQDVLPVFTSHAIKEAKDNYLQRRHAFVLKYADNKANRIYNLYWLCSTIKKMKSEGGWKVSDELEKEVSQDIQEVEVYGACHTMVGLAWKVQETFVQYMLQTLEGHISLYCVYTPEMLDFLGAVLRDTMGYFCVQSDTCPTMRSGTSPDIIERHSAELKRLMDVLQIPSSLLSKNGLEAVFADIVKEYQRIHAYKQEDTTCPPYTLPPDMEDVEDASDKEYCRAEYLIDAYTELLKQAQEMRQTDLGIMKQISQKMMTLQSQRGKDITEMVFVKHKVDIMSLEKSISEKKESFRHGDPLQSKLRLKYSFKDHEVNISKEMMAVQHSRGVKYADRRAIDKISIKCTALKHPEGHSLSSINVEKNSKDAVLQCLSTGIKIALWESMISVCVAPAEGSPMENIDLSASSTILPINVVVDIMTSKTTFVPTWPNIVKSILQEYAAWRSSFISSADGMELLWNHKKLKTLLGPLQYLKSHLFPKLIEMQEILRYLHDFKFALQEELSRYTGVMKIPVLFTPPEVYLSDPTVLFFPWKIGAVVECLQHGISLKPNTNDHAPSCSEELSLLEDLADAPLGLAHFKYNSENGEVPLIDISSQNKISETIVEASRHFVAQSSERESYQNGVLDNGLIQIHAASTLMSITLIVWKMMSSDKYTDHLKVSAVCIKDREAQELEDCLSRELRNLQNTISDHEHLEDERDRLNRSLSDGVFLMSESERRKLVNKLDSLENSILNTALKCGTVREGSVLLEEKLKLKRLKLVDEKILKDKEAYERTSEAMLALLGCGVSYLSKWQSLSENEDRKCPWSTALSDRDQTLEDLLEVYSIQVEGIVENFDKLVIPSVEKVFKLCKTFTREINARLDELKKALVELNSSDPFRKCTMYLLDIFKLGSNVAKRAIQHHASVVEVVTKDKKSSSGMYPALSTLQIIGPSMKNLSKKLIDHGQEVINIVEQALEPKAFIAAVRNMQKLPYDFLDLDTKSLLVINGYSASLNFVQEYVRMFVWHHCVYLNTQLPLGTYKQELKSTLLKYGVAERRLLEADDPKLMETIKCLQSSLWSIAGGVECQQVQALMDYPSCPLQVLWMLQDTTLSIGDRFLPAAIYAEHLNGGLLKLGGAIVACPVLQDESLTVIHVLDKSYEVLRMTVPNTSEIPALNLRSITELGEALEKMAKCLVKHRPACITVVYHLTKRFKAFKEEVTVACMQTVSCWYRTAAADKEPLPDSKEPLGMGNNQEEELDSIFETYPYYTLANMANIHATQSNLTMDSAEDKITVAALHELATALKYGIPGVFHMLVECFDGASGTIEPQDMLTCYQKAAKLALEALDSKIIKHIKKNDASSPTIEVPDALKTTDKALFELYQVVNDRIHDSFTLCYIDDLQSVRCQVAQLKADWNERGLELIEARNEERNGMFQRVLDKAWNMFWNSNKEQAAYEEYCRKKSHLVALAKRIYFLCRQIGLAGDINWCDAVAQSMARSCKKLERSVTELSPESKGFVLTEIAYVSLQSVNLPKDATDYPHELAVTCISGGKSQHQKRNLSFVEGAMGLSTNFSFWVENKNFFCLKLVFADNCGNEWESPDGLNPGGRNGEFKVRFLQRPGAIALFSVSFRSCYCPRIATSQPDSVHTYSCTLEIPPQVHIKDVPPFGFTSMEYLDCGEGSTTTAAFADGKDTCSSIEDLNRLKQDCMTEYWEFDQLLLDLPQQSVKQPQKVESPEKKEHSVKQEMSKREEQDASKFNSLEITCAFEKGAEGVLELQRVYEKFFEKAQLHLADRKGNLLLDLVPPYVEKIASVLAYCHDCMLSFPTGNSRVAMFNSLNKDNNKHTTCTVKMIDICRQCHSTMAEARVLGCMILNEVFYLLAIGVTCSALQISSLADVKKFKKQKSSTGALFSSIMENPGFTNGCWDNKFRRVMQCAAGIAKLAEKRLRHLSRVEELKNHLSNMEPSDAGCLASCYFRQLGQVFFIPESSGDFSSAPIDQDVEFGYVMYTDTKEKKDQSIRIVTLVNKTADDIYIKVEVPGIGCSGTFSVLPLGGRLPPGTAMDLECSLKPNTVGHFKETWSIEGSNSVGSHVAKSSLNLVGTVQKLQVEFDKNTIDFGYVRQDYEEKREIKLRNKTMMPFWVKSQIQSGMYAVGLEVSCEGFMLGPEAVEAISVTLKAGGNLGCIAHELIVGIASSNYIHSIPIRAEVVRPTFEFLSSEGVPLGNHAFVALPTARYGQSVESWFELRNTGKINLHFKLCSGSIHMVVTHNGAGELHPGKTCRIRTSTENTAWDRFESVLYLDVEGCSTRCIKVKVCSCIFSSLAHNYHVSFNCVPKSVMATNFC